MIQTLTVNLLVGSVLLLLGLLGWRLFGAAEKDSKNFSTADLAKNSKIYGLFLAGLLLPFAFAGLLGLSFANSFLFLIGGFFLPAILSSLGLSHGSRSILILLLSIAVTALVPEDGYRLSFAAFIAGLASWKAVDYFLISDEAKPGSLEDFLPAFLFVVGIYWTKTADTANWIPIHQKLILGAVSVSMLMRAIQGQFLSNDKLYFKRISLAVTGALFMLIYINQFIVALELGKIAVIAGAGYFLTYLFDAMSKSCDQEDRVLSDLKKVLFIGIFTLLVSRLFGMLGLVVLAMSMLISTTSGVALIAAAFWGARVLAQSFIFDFNSNMTGINIMHTYAGAALYGGFFLVVALSLLIARSKSRLATGILFTAATVIAPVTTVYFLHAEPAASLFYAALVAASLLAVVAPSIYGETEAAASQGALMLIPPQLLAFGVLVNELISRGNTADLKERVIVLVAVSVLSSAILWIAFRFMPKEESSASAG